MMLKTISTICMWLWIISQAALVIVPVIQLLRDDVRNDRRGPART